MDVLISHSYREFDTESNSQTQVDRKADRQNYLFLVSFPIQRHLTPASRLRVESRRDRRGRNEEQLRVNKRTSKYPRKRKEYKDFIAKNDAAD